MPVVSRLSTAAVKGTALHHHQKLQLSDNGMVDNRRFYLVDGQHRLFNGKQHGPLVRLKAEYDRNRQHLTLRFPESAAMEGSTTELGEAVHTDFYGRDHAGVHSLNRTPARRDPRRGSPEPPTVSHASGGGWLRCARGGHLGRPNCAGGSSTAHRGGPRASLRCH